MPFRKFFFIGVVILTGLAASLLMAMKGCVKTPEMVNLEKIDFTSIQDSTAGVAITCLVRNPNKVGATVEKIMADLFIEGEKVGRVDSEVDIKLKANGETSMTLPASLNLALLSKLFPSLMEKDSSLLEIKGDFYVKAGIAKFTIESKTGKKMPMREELKKMVQSKLGSGALRVQGIRPKSVSMEKSSLEISVAFANDMDIDFTINKLALKLYMPNQSTSFGSWTLQETTKLAARSKKTMSADVEMDNQLALQQMLGNIFGKKVVIAKGTASVELGGYPFEVPVSQEVGMGVF